MRHSIPTAALACLMGGSVLAAPVTYEIDPRHTFPGFEADHFGGVSVWRGKFGKTTGSITLDREARTGTIDVSIDTASVMTGLDDMDKHLRSADFFDVEKHPVATYKGTLAEFKNGAPTVAEGTLTLRGVTHPVTLNLKSFKCIAHPMKKGAELCGADAHATIDREQYGITYGKNLGFAMWVRLEIQVEAVATR